MVKSFRAPKSLQLLFIFKFQKERFNKTYQKHMNYLHWQKQPLAMSKLVHVHIADMEERGFKTYTAESH